MVGLGFERDDDLVMGVMVGDGAGGDGGLQPVSDVPNESIY